MVNSISNLSTEDLPLATCSSYQMSSLFSTGQMSAFNFLQQF